MVANRILLAGFFVILICTWKNSRAQSDIPFLERKITIQSINQKPEEILRLIEKQGGFTFSFDPQVVQGQKEIVMDHKNKPVREVLDKLFDGQVSYKEKGKHIILFRITSEEQSKKNSYYIITGYIKNGVNGEEVTEASIFDKKSKESAVSNQYGYFNLRINSKQKDELLILSVNKVNYKDTLVYVRQTGKSIVNITIYPDVKQIAIVDSSAIRDSILAVNQLAFINMILSQEAQTNTLNINDTFYSKFQWSLLPFLGSNLSLSGNTVNDYSFNILAGYSMGTRKLEIGGLVNVDRDSVKNVQIAGWANITGGPVQGLQAAGLVNFNMKTVNGCQLAGLINNNLDTSHVAGFAGLMNINLKPSSGFLAAGLMNLNIKKTTSPQFAGITNIAIDDAKGIQVSGLLNVCIKDIHGVQISGLVNYANHVHGTQIGFLNISDSCSGVPVGFLSYVHKGYHQLEISADEVFPLNASFRTGVHSFYNIFSAGIKSLGEPDNIWYFGYGLGTAINLGKKWDLNVDLIMNQPMVGNQLDYFNPLTKLNLTAEKRFSKSFSLAAGPVFNLFSVNTTDPNFDGVFNNLPPAQTFSSSVSGDYKHTSWIGGKVALRFF